MTREYLIEAIQQLEAARTDRETAAALARVKDAAPHGYISDLIFYGERDRTSEEIADEALLRERIWAEQGQVALNTYIESQLLAVLADTKVPADHYTKLSANALLARIRKAVIH